MARRVPDHILQQVAHSVDFVRIAGRYCDLKKKGKSYWACCPFHKEKTPSFSIDPENNLYYCFGCKEGGNVFTFLQKLDGLSFAEALNALAAEAGVDLQQYRTADAPSRSDMGKLREINELATSFYQKCLQKGKGSDKTRDYLAGRQIKVESVERWRLGFAPEGWDNFLKCARGRGYDPKQVARAGLALERTGAPGHYDRFRNRLIFPITDTVGRTIGFGARALDPEDEPKYLNTSDTPLFSKGRSFFGLAQAKEAIRSGKAAVVLEGYTDVIMAHQEGVPEAIAVLGTALTEDHARTLGRLCERVILVFDPDEAGQKSATRSIEVLLNEEMDIRVAGLPEGLDPCDYLIEHGGAEFRRRVDESKDFFQFRLDIARSHYDMSTVQGTTAAFREMAQLAVALKDNARRDMVVRWIARELGVRERDAWTHVAGRIGRAGRRAAGAQPDEEAPKLSAEQTLPVELLGFLLAHEEFVSEAVEQVDLTLLQEGPEKAVLRQLCKNCAESGSVSARKFLASLADPALASSAARALAEEQARARSIAAVTLRERFDGYVRYLRRKELELSTAPLNAPDDDQLRELERRLREKDSKSAQWR